MERRLLGKTGLELSILGFGASPLGGVFGDIEQAEADAAVRTAIDVRVALLLHSLLSFPFSDFSFFPFLWHLCAIDSLESTISTRAPSTA